MGSVGTLHRGRFITPAARIGWADDFVKCVFLDFCWGSFLEYHAGLRSLWDGEVLLLLLRISALGTNALWEMMNDDGGWSYLEYDGLDLNGHSLLI